MNFDFDFETLYKNERKSLKEIFDTLSKHLETTDIINNLTENEKYYIKLHIANNKNIEPYKPSLIKRLVESIQIGWLALEDLMLFLIRIWSLIVIALAVLIIYRKFFRKSTPKS